MIIDIFNNLANKICEFSKEIYKDNLVSFVVYGSLGRGCVNYFSDIDILIIAEKLPNGRLERIKQFEKVEKKLEKDIKEAKNFGIHTYISAILKTKEEVIRGSPIFLDMIYDAIILYDKDNFFKDYLEQMKDRLDKLGAKRIMQGTRWYWILKPDYKPGEKFEI